MSIVWRKKVTKTGGRFPADGRRKDAYLLFFLIDGRFYSRPEKEIDTDLFL